MRASFLFVAALVAGNISAHAACGDACLAGFRSGLDAAYARNAAPDAINGLIGELKACRETCRIEAPEDEAPAPPAATPLAGPTGCRWLGLTQREFRSCCAAARGRLVASPMAEGGYVLLSCRSRIPGEFRLDALYRSGDDRQLYARSI